MKKTKNTATPTPHPDRNKEAAMPETGEERRASVKAERVAWEARAADAYARMVEQTATQ